MELLEENEDAGEIYMVTRRQYRTAEQGRVVDIDILAVQAVMDLYGVQDQRACLEKVRMLFHHMRGQYQQEGE